jgi:hypothetical protein
MTQRSQSQKLQILKATLNWTLRRFMAYVMKVLQSFDDALQEDEGWGWISIDLALVLYQASTKFQHWNSSVLELAVESGSSMTQGGETLEEDAAMQELLATL